MGQGSGDRQRVHTRTKYTNKERKKISRNCDKIYSIKEANKALEQEKLLEMGRERKLL